MKRIWGHVLSLFVAGCAASAMMPGCATNDQTVFVRGALAPSNNRVNGVCTYTGDPQQTQLFFGFVDLGLSDSYFSVLLVGNQLIPRNDPTANRAESNRVHINGGVIRVSETDGTTIREFTSSATGFADPSQNGLPGYSSIGLITLDAPTKDLILNTPPGLPNRQAIKTVLLNIKVFGRSLGGVDVESDEFQLPLQICKGCLVDFSTGNDPLQKPNPNCLKSTSAMGAAMTVKPCIFGQDEVVPCQSCITFNKICDPQTP
jgi:hypothetical protein